MDPEVDRYLLDINVNERTISHRIAIHLENLIAGWNEEWHVDCEYNRDVNANNEPYSKNIIPGGVPGEPGYDDADATTCYPDIIIHRRGTGTNLLAIEIKKSSSAINGDFDREIKLPAYRNQLNYQYTCFILVGVGEDIRDTAHEWIPDPQPVNAV